MKALDKNKKAQMHVFLILFSLIMAIGLVIAIYNILAFESRAKNMMDAAIDAQYFRKDYMLAMLMPVQDVTICHKTLLNDNKCALYVKTPRHTDTRGFKYPEVSVEIQDPSANISATLGVEVRDIVVEYDALDPFPFVKEAMTAPEIRAMGAAGENCWNYGAYKYCKFICTKPIQITKTREYDTTYSIYVDKMSVSQFMGDQCLA